MLINLRNALMTGKRLPYDAELEYLESTGTQWIDTGVVASQNIKIEARFYRAVNPSNFAYGVRSGGTTISCATGSGTSTATMGYVRWGNSAYAAAIPNTEVVVVQDKDGVTVNGVHYNYTATESVVSQPGYTIALFAAKNSATTTTQNLTGKFWYCKIWDNGTLVRDYIPVRVGTVGYLYDRVSRKLFGNAGTGDFVVGQDVVPVEYIESHGTEYIDTGLNSTTDSFCNFDIRFRKTTIQTSASMADYNMPFGYKYGANARYGIYAGTSTSDANAYVGVDKTNSVTTTKDTNWHTIKLENGVAVTIDGASTSVASGTVRSNIGLLLFATVTSSSGASDFLVVSSQMSYCKIYNTSGNALRDYKPVRVGTEGAMMDVLTRRIYRNAGTGAFTYGNDLKYPIPSE